MLFTQTANVRSMRLAAKLGFTEVERFEAYGAEQWFGVCPRQAVRTPLGLRVKSYVDKGDLVPDGVVMDMLRKPVLAAASGYVLDGFPRTVDQAKASYDVVRALGAEVQAAIHLDVPREELIGRLLARGRGSEDTQSVIEHRLQVYQENTLPLLEYYAGREWMFTVNGDRPTDTVHEDIVGRIQKLASFIAST